MDNQGHVFCEISFPSIDSCSPALWFPYKYIMGFMLDKRDFIIKAYPPLSARLCSKNLEQDCNSSIDACEFLELLLNIGHNFIYNWHLEKNLWSMLLVLIPLSISDHKKTLCFNWNGVFWVNLKRRSCIGALAINLFYIFIEE